MTEDEAKAKWCPFANPEAVSAMRISEAIGRPQHTLCIASACMAWRWNDERVTTGDNAYQQIYTRGYCGLAGAPS